MPDSQYVWCLYAIAILYINYYCIWLWFSLTFCCFLVLLGRLLLSCSLLVSLWSQSVEREGSPSHRTSMSPVPTSWWGWSGHSMYPPGRPPHSQLSPGKSNKEDMTTHCKSKRRNDWQSDFLCVWTQSGLDVIEFTDLNKSAKISIIVTFCDILCTLAALVLAPGHSQPAISSVLPSPSHLVVQE